ncbi:endonuclease/exonuclease/phosphatase family protein, partial [Chitinophagales bacterium]|nr:endonuclease/exonuclease/phosphatase family protein [Chitinophagales bacterium]
GQRYGIATFSRFPLSEKRKISLPGSRTNLITSCIVELQKKVKVQLFNVHLQSFKLGREDYQLIEELPDKGPDIEQSKSLLRKLKKGFEMRALQADILREAMDQSVYPVVVAGDFNDTPVSYTYQTLSNGMTDAFLKGGFGSGGTYAGPLPSFRIDYLLADSLFVIHDFEVISNSNTDHYPITTTLSLSQ